MLYYHILHTEVKLESLRLPFQEQTYIFSKIPADIINDTLI